MYRKRKTLRAFYLCVCVCTANTYGNRVFRFVFFFFYFFCLLDGSCTALLQQCLMELMLCRALILRPLLWFPQHSHTNIRARIETNAVGRCSSLFVFWMLFLVIAFAFDDDCRRFNRFLSACAQNHEKLTPKASRYDFPNDFLPFLLLLLLPHLSICLCDASNANECSGKEFRMEKLVCMTEILLRWFWLLSEHIIFILYVPFDQL